MSIISASVKRWSGVLETPNWSRVLIEHMNRGVIQSPVGTIVLSCTWCEAYYGHIDTFLFSIFHTLICKIHTLICKFYTLICKIYTLICKIYTLICKFYTLICKIYTLIWETPNWSRVLIEHMNRGVFQSPVGTIVLSCTWSSSVPCCYGMC
jgi:hypothetical protein